MARVEASFKGGALRKAGSVMRDTAVVNGIYLSEMAATSVHFGAAERNRTGVS